jgi:hypothetical protein
VIVAEGEGGLGWASYVLYGDPSFVLLGESELAPEPVLPTPADIANRESIRAVMKKPSRSPTSGERARAPSVPAPAVSPPSVQPPRSASAAGTWAIAITLAAIALAMLIYVVLHHR